MPKRLLAALLLASTAAGRGRKKRAAESAEHDRLLAAGRLHVEGGRHAEALASLDAAVLAARAGGSALTHTYRGVALLSTSARLCPEAIAAYDAAIRRDPRAHNAFFGKGKCFREGRPARLDEAVSALQQAIELAPGWADPHMLLCVTEKDRYTQAVEAWHMRPDSPRVDPETFLKGALPGCDAAIAAADRANPATVAAAYKTKGQILRSMHRFAEAQHFADAGLRLDPHHRRMGDALGALDSHYKGWMSEHRGALHLLWPHDDASRVISGRVVPEVPAAQHFTLTPGEATGAPGSSPQWHTPVWIHSLPGRSETEALNNELSMLISSVRARDPSGANVSNVGGWQSKGVKLLGIANGASWTVTASQADAVKTLHRHILGQVEKFLAALHIAGTVSVSVTDSWANVNTLGAWNNHHVHGTATWSGCYYVQSGWGDDYAIGDTDEIGDYRLYQSAGVIFRDPQDKTPQPLMATLKTGPQGWKVPHTNLPGAAEWTDAALGESGTLAIWPGSVFHRVPQHFGGSDRISIAFNVGLTME